MHRLNLGLVLLLVPQGLLKEISSSVFLSHNQNLEKQSKIPQLGKSQHTVPRTHANVGSKTFLYMYAETVTFFPHLFGSHLAVLRGQECPSPWSPRLFCWEEGTQDSAQGLTAAVCSGITPSSAQTICCQASDYGQSHARHPNLVTIPLATLTFKFLKSTNSQAQVTQLRAYCLLPLFLTS